MKSAPFDEFQLFKRYRIAFHTMAILVIVIMLNGYIKFLYGDWADPLVEAFVLLLLPSLYFIIRAIAANAYLRENQQPLLLGVMMGAAAVLSGAAVFSSVFGGLFIIWEDGRLTPRTISLFLTVYTGATSIALIVRYVMNKRATREMEEDEM